MIFTENQATQFYVAKKVITGDEKVKNPGDIKFVKSKDDQSFYFEIMGHGGQLRSAVVEKKNLLWAKLTRAAAMATPRKKVTIKLNSEVNEGKPAVGQDYTMNVFFRQYTGLSDENIHVKTAVAHAYNDKVDVFYQKLAVSLYLNMIKEIVPLVQISLKATEDGVIAGLKNVDGVKVPVNAKGDVLTGSAEYGIVLTEAEQPWTLGIQEQVPVYFDVMPTTVYINGDEQSWGKVESGWTDTKVANGRKIADMEYFFMGERGDQYRNIGWPNVIPTKYLVEPYKENGDIQEFDTINIHFAYVGANESVQKSEQEIMIVGIASEIDNLKTSLDDLITLEEITK